MTGSRTVGQVAEEFGVTVRTLHHYDSIGLLPPSERSMSGYRLYTDADVQRLALVVSYRRLGFSLDEVAELLADDADRAGHLRRQRAAVMARLDEMRDLVAAIDHALENEMSNTPMTEQDMREMFGESYDEYQGEAEQRWGDTEAWRQSAERTKNYTKADWVRIKEDNDRVNAAIAAAFDAGLAPTSKQAMDAVEAHRRSIDDYFYDCDAAFHRCLGQMYTQDTRYVTEWGDGEPAAVAQWVNAAIQANADRLER